jgi:hypothetical protein
MLWIGNASNYSMMRDRTRPSFGGTDGQSYQEEDSEEEDQSAGRSMDESAACRTSEALEGKNTYRADFETNEADRGRATPAGDQAWYQPGTSALGC